MDGIWAMIGKAHQHSSATPNITNHRKIEIAHLKDQF